MNTGKHLDSVWAAQMLQSVGTVQAVPHLQRTVSVLLLSVDGRVSPCRTVLWSICRLIWSCQPHPNTSVICLHGPPHYASRKMPFRKQTGVTRVRTVLLPTCSGFFLPYWSPSFFNEGLQYGEYNLVFPQICTTVLDICTQLFLLRGRTAMLMVPSAPSTLPEMLW